MSGTFLRICLPQASMVRVCIFRDFCAFIRDGTVTEGQERERGERETGKNWQMTRAGTEAGSLA